MSDASNLGYGNVIPNSNVNNSFANVSATNNPANFSSNETGLAASGGHGMLGASNNAAAAAGCLGGVCNMTAMQQKGGSRSGSRRRKYNNMRKKYSKMKHRRSRRHSRRHRTRSRTRARARYHNRRLAAALKRSLARSRSRYQFGGGVPVPYTPASIKHSGGGVPVPYTPATIKQSGGYHQYMGNVPSTPAFSVAGTTLGASSSALANPPPITRLGCEGSSCVDNYNHYTNKGFQAWN